MRLHTFGIVVTCLLVAAFWSVWFFAPTAPVGIVVPHHDMVASTRLAYFHTVREQRSVETIVVISPDHFARSKQSIIVGNEAWDTVYGTIAPDTDLVTSLGFPVDNEPFLREHGVTSLLADIKNVFPAAKIVPVLMSTRATYEDVEAFVTVLNDTCSSCLLVASVDFSHTNVASIAALHDVATLRALYRQDAEALFLRAEVDSPQSLTALALWGDVHNARAFELFSHTNSGHITGAATGEMTTHIIGGYQVGRVRPPADAVTFMIGGDTMFARGVATHMEQTGRHPFQTIGERFFWGVDIALVNLEGVFTQTEPSLEEWQAYPPKLRFAASNIPLLSFLRLSAVGLANNHAADGGDIDDVFTRQQLEKYGITVVGGATNDSTIRIMRYQDGAITVAILALATHVDFTTVLEQITALRKAGDRVVVFAHWGTEYASNHTIQQERMAKDWIDAGASLILGSHPHVVQNVSVYQGVPIVYSLGNFLFDQAMIPETQVGAVASGMFTEEGLHLTLIPVKSFLETSVLDSAAHEAQQSKWTEGWSAYKQDDGEYFFPHTR